MINRENKSMESKKKDLKDNIVKWIKIMKSARILVVEDEAKLTWFIELKFQA